MLVVGFFSSVLSLLPLESRVLFDVFIMGHMEYTGEIVGSSKRERVALWSGGSSCPLAFALQSTFKEHKDLASHFSFDRSPRC